MVKFYVRLLDFHRFYGYAVILAFLRLRDIMVRCNFSVVNMKTIATIPILLALGLISSSCGSSPKEEEPVIRRLVPPPLAPQIRAPASYNQAAIPVNSAIPVANRVAGRPGFVFNPYNQNMVEVNGMISGTKVRDPQDPDPSHIFVVP